MNLDPALDKVKKIIASVNGQIVKEENDGKKRLAYKIGGQEFAVFYYYDVQLPAEAPAKISSTLNITDEVLRYLLVRTDTMRAKLAAQKAEESEKSEAKDSKSTEEKGE